MVAARQVDDPVTVSLEMSSERDHGLRNAAIKLLHVSGYTPLRRLRCEVTDAVVILTGVVPSYYLKQMAQTIIQRLEGVQSVMNLVEVREADHESPAQHAGDGGPAMNQATGILEIEQEGEMLLLKPVIELRDLDEMEIEEAVDELLERMDHSGVTDVFLDLHRTDVLHSQASQLAVELWEQVRRHGGSMAICLI